MTIDEKYTQLGGASGFLGKPVSQEMVCPDQTGHFRHYENGSIYWSPASDAHEVHGAIRDRWSALGWETSWLGYPISDEGPEFGGGRISHFQNGFIDWSPAAGAVDRGAIQFQAYHNVTFDQHQTHYNTLAHTGWRMRSLSVYGDSPRYAAVWVNQGGPEWSAIHGASADQWQAFYNEWNAKQFRPTLVAATGSGSGTVFAAVMEKTDGPIPITHHGLTPNDFLFWNAWAAENYFILTTAALYGDSGDPRIIAVWDVNRDNTQWSVDNTPGSLLESFSQSQAVFNAEISHGSRPYHVIPSAYGQWLVGYRGDSVGPWNSYTSLSADDYQSQFNQHVAQGYYPDSLHVGGDDDDDATFSVILTKRLAPLPKHWVATGQAVPSMMHFDEAMQGYMQRNNIRAASLAVAKGSKLMYARAFTWAEPGYPITQPTDLFRVGSCSKCLNSILVHQLMQEGSLSYGDSVVDKLALTPPPGQKIINPDFTKYQIWHLLCHESGIASDFASDDAAVVALFGKQLPAMSKWEIASWLMTQKKIFDVGTQYSYANSNFIVLGALVEKLRGVEWFQTFKDRVITPLGLKHCAVSGSLLSQRVAGEAFYDNQDLAVYPSLMTPDQPLVHSGYGNVNLSVGECVGGMALAPADFVKILVALDLGKGDSNPVLSTQSVTNMWSSPNDLAQNNGATYGWGFTYVPGGARALVFEGALDDCHTFIEHRMDGYSMCMAFNTGQRPFAVAPDVDDLIESTTQWPTVDLFPSLGLPAF
jgi:CubicO group peptidase (beta-lactamase class C family)